MAHFNRLVASFALVAMFLALPSAHAYDWIAGESGIALQWQPNCLANSPQGQCTATPTTTSLAGANVTILFQPDDQSLPLATHPATVINNGANAMYVMTSSDFPTAGLWDIEFIAILPNGERKAQIVTKNVGPALQ